MNTYTLRYISGPQASLSVSRQETVSAPSIEEALARRSQWPIEHNWANTCAWSKNPGTSLYHVEAWEATLVS